MLTRASASPFLSSGRGRIDSQAPQSYDAAVNAKPTDQQYFMRNVNNNGLDGVAFHYSVYRGLTRFLGMDGNLRVAYDTDVNFITAYNQMVVYNDFLNAATGEFDVRHM